MPSPSTMSDRLPALTVPLLRFAAPLLALPTATGILSYSIFLAPAVRDLVATSPTAALRQLRYYFEAGKPVVSPLAVLNTALWLALAYLDPSRGSIGLGLSKRAGYLAAAAGAFGIIPLSMFYIIPVTNDRILELDDQARREGDAGMRGKEALIRGYVRDFERENWVRGGMYALGGAVGLWTVLA
jgi:hypothetical protein